VYRWDFDGPARLEFATLGPAAQVALAAFMNAAVIVDPIQYQRHPGEPADPPACDADYRSTAFPRHHAAYPTIYRVSADGDGLRAPALP
jgi:hypothetical protein